MKEFTTDFIPVPFVAVKDVKLTPASRMILGIIYYIVEKRGEKFFMSNKYIADILGMSAGSINNSLKLLEENGYIKREYNEDKTKRLEIKCFIKLQKVTSTDVGGTLFNVGGTSTDAQNKIPNKINKKELCTETEIKDRFEVFRQLYKKKLKGKSKTLDTEYNNFKNKHPKLNNVDSIREIEVQLGKYYSELLGEFESGREDAFKFVPHLSTYINQKRWEHYQD